MEFNRSDYCTPEETAIALGVRVRRVTDGAREFILTGKGKFEGSIIYPGYSRRYLIPVDTVRKLVDDPEFKENVDKVLAPLNEILQIVEKDQQDIEKQLTNHYSEKNLPEWKKEQYFRFLGQLTYNEHIASKIKSLIKKRKLIDEE